MRYLFRTWFGIAGCSLILASGLALAAGKAG